MSNMKKLLLFLILVTISQYSYSFSTGQNEDPEKEKIDLIERPTSEPNKDRSLMYVECLYDKSRNVLEIEYSGIETPIVYVIDANENIVWLQSSERMSNKLIVNLPPIQGTYRLIIQSRVYCGEGILHI